MYFAIEPTHPEWAAQVHQVLTERCVLFPDTPMHLFALVDGAFDEQLLGSHAWIRQPKLSLYAQTALQGFGAAAPHLLTAPPLPAQQLPWLQKITAACAGKPMLSVLASPLDAQALQQHLRPYLVARTPDTLEWPLRWADTRVLPALLDALEKLHRQHFMAPLLAWWSARRDGGLCQWIGDATSTVDPAEFDKLPLSDAAFTALVDTAEADAVLANIYESQPDLLHRHSPAQSHASLVQHLKLASRHRIEAAPDRQHFCVLALSLKENFADHPAMATLLQNTRQGVAYQTAIAVLPPEFWQETQS